MAQTHTQLKYQPTLKFMANPWNHQHKHFSKLRNDPLDFPDYIFNPQNFRKSHFHPKPLKIFLSTPNIFQIIFWLQVFQNYIFTPKVLKNAQRLLRSQKYILTLILCQIKMFSFKNNNLSNDIILIFYKHLTFLLLVISLYLFAWEIFWGNECKIYFVRLYTL